MGYTRITYGKTNGLYNYSEFICDNIADLTALPTVNKSGTSGSDSYNPCSVGSKAFVVSGSRYYIMSNAGEWIQVDASVADI